jgi:hypothetical protein
LLTDDFYSGVTVAAAPCRSSFRVPQTQFIDCTLHGLRHGSKAFNGP